MTGGVVAAPPGEYPFDCARKSERTRLLYTIFFCGVCQQGGRGDDQETGKKRAGKFHDHVSSPPGHFPGFSPSPGAEPSTTISGISRTSKLGPSFPLAISWQRSWTVLGSVVSGASGLASNTIAVFCCFGAMASGF